MLDFVLEPQGQPPQAARGGVNFGDFSGIEACLAAEHLDFFALISGAVA